MISPYSIAIGGSQIIAITSEKSLCPSLLVGICFQPELPVELSVKTLSLQEAFGSGRHDAISGEDDRPVKRLKHLLLSQSHFAIIAHQMLVLLQLRIKWSDNISLWV